MYFDSEEKNNIIADTYKIWITGLSRLKNVNIVDLRSIDKLYGVSAVFDSDRDARAHIPVSYTHLQ